MLPSENSRWFHQTSEEIRALVARAEEAVGNNRSKEFISTVTDLKILSNLALFHARRIPAAVSYRLFERTEDAAALEEAIAYEKNAIEAWRQLVAAASDVYANDLKMGVCNSGLCGHWSEELTALEEGLASLEQESQRFTAETPVREVSLYEAATGASDDQRFEITHQPVASVAAGDPLTVSIEASAPAGIKWVRLRHRSVNQEFDYQTLEMTQNGEEDTFQATVPAGEIDPTWDYMYYFEIMDNDGNGTIYPDLNKEAPYIFVTLNR